MSRNYYARWHRQSSGIHVSLSFHIGKTNGPGGLSTMCGMVFPTKDAWKTFLRHNQAQIEIEDEESYVYSVERFIEGYIDVPSESSRQIKWLREHGYFISDSPVSYSPTQDSRDGYWIEDDMLFYNGEFS